MTFILAALVACLILPIGAATTPASPIVSLVETQDPVAPGQLLGWDYTDAQVAAGAVTRFEVQWDAGPWVNVGMSRQLGTPSTYVATVPALVTGNHSVIIRACNDLACGDPTSPFAFVLAVKPGAVSNVRFLSGGGL